MMVGLFPCLGRLLVLGVFLGAEPAPNSASQSAAHSATSPQEPLAPPDSYFSEWLERTGETPPDFTKFTSHPDLPPVLQFEDGKPVTTPAVWNERRQQLKTLLETYVIGSFPKVVPPLAGAEVVSQTSGPGYEQRLVKLTFDTKTKTTSEVSFTIELLTPKGSGPFPTFLTQTNHRRWGLEALARGYAVCIYPGADSDDQTAGFRDAYPEADWALLAQRAWLCSRTIDYLVTLPELDPKQIGLTGHSRNGKQSLIAAAFDDRIAAVVSSNSGASGCCAYRWAGEDTFGESVEFMTRNPTTRTWFHPRLRWFTGREDLLPVDTHAFSALIAPRPLLLSWALNDGCASTYAEEQTYLAALPVYELLGQPDHLRIRWRHANHETNAQAIESYVDWFNLAFGRGHTEFPQTFFHAFDWKKWKAAQSEQTLPSFDAMSGRERIAWSMGKQPALGVDPGGVYGSETAHEATMLRHNPAKGTRKLSLTFGANVRGDLYYPEKAKGPLPVVIWLHPRSFAYGYAGSYMKGPAIYHTLPQHGVAVFAFDQLGFGGRLEEGRDFYARYPEWSKLGKMVADANAAVGIFAADNQLGRDKLAMPAIDSSRIYLAGYSVGGTVALYTAAENPHIAGVASFCGLAPLQDASPIGRHWLTQWTHKDAYQPRLGYFASDVRKDSPEAPYEMDEVLLEIAPRPCLLVAPEHDRHVNEGAIAAITAKAKEDWAAKGHAADLVVESPNDYNRFQTEQVHRLLAWIDSLKEPAASPAQ